MSSPVEQLLAIEGAPPLVEGKQSGWSGDSHDGPALVSLAGDGPARWLRGDHCTVLARPLTSMVEGTVFARFGTDEGQTLYCVDGGDGCVHVPFSFTEAYEAFTLER